MTQAEFKAAHPEAYAAAVAEGIAQEKDRVEACLVYNEIDPAGVKAAIEAGKPLTQKQMAEFSLKAQSVATLEKLKGDNAKPVVPGAEVEKPDGKPAEKKAEEKEVEDFSKGLTAHMKQHKMIA